MYELTTGDERYIAESARPWKMTIDTILGRIDDIPAEVAERIQSLSDSYTEEFGKYYLQAMQEDENRLAAPILREFDGKWESEHPEFYDIDRLFEGTDPAELEKAKDAIEAAKEAFAGE